MNEDLLAAVEQALSEGKGATAERLLRSLIDLIGDHSWLRARLGRSLLLQGAFRQAEAELLPLATSPSVSFWTLHKLGDALWGQRKLRQASYWYGLAVDKGGISSTLTVSNHLVLLDLIDSRLAVDWVERQWQTVPDPGSAWIQGAQQASRVSSGPSLQLWLQSKGVAMAAQPQANQSAAELPLRISPDYRRHWQYSSRGLGVVGYLGEGQKVLGLMVEVPAGCSLALELGSPMKPLAASVTVPGFRLQLRRSEVDGTLLLNPFSPAADECPEPQCWRLMLWLSSEEGNISPQPCLWLRAIPDPISALPMDAAWLNRDPLVSALPEIEEDAFRDDPFWEQDLDAQLWTLVNDRSQSDLIELHIAAQKRHWRLSNVVRTCLALLIEQRAAQLRAGAAVLPRKEGSAARFVFYWDYLDKVPHALKECISELMRAFPTSLLLSEETLDAERLDFGPRPLVWLAFQHAPHPALRSDLFRLGLTYRDHGWLDLDVRCSPLFPSLADQLLSQCCTQGISLVPLLKQPGALWGSPASCLEAYPVNAMLVLAPGFRQRLLDQLESDLAGASGGGQLIDWISGPGLLSRCLWSVDAGCYRLDGFIITDLEPLPIWLNELGERFVMPGFDIMGLSSLPPEDKYQHPQQDWRNLTTQQLDAFLTDLAHHATAP